MVAEAHNQREFEKLSESMSFFRKEDSCARTMKVSPYIYREGLTVVRTQKKDCSRQRMQKLVKEGSFTKLQEQILFILDQFGFLNAYLLRMRLSFLTGNQPLKKEIMRTVLKGLVENGLLVQYELSYTDKNGRQQGSPFFYGLAAGGRRYLKQCRKKKPLVGYPDEEVSCGLLLRLLSENQFAIAVESEYKSSGILTYIDFSSTVYAACGVRMLYGLRTMSGREIALYSFSVRQDEGWEDLYLNQLSELAQYMEKSASVSASVLVIVETEWLAMDCEQVRSDRDDLAALDIFYATDTSFIEEESVFDRLIEVKKVKDEMARFIFRLELKKPDNGNLEPVETADMVNADGTEDENGAKGN